MPGFFTHYLCGLNLYNRLGNNPLKELIDTNREAFNLGTQGPDIFFFYLRWPWWGGKGVNQKGSLLHREKTGDFFASAISYAANASAGDRAAIQAYLSGYACHYALDLNTHPYVYYKTGFVRSGEKKISKFSIHHTRFETALDVLMLKRELSAAPTQLNGGKLITPDRKSAEAVGHLYNTAFKEVYGLTIKAEQAVKAIYDMGLVYRLLRDRTGMKKALLGLITGLTGYENVAFDLLHPKRLPDNIDYLNLGHKPWYMPWDNELPHHESFPELFEKAAAEAEELCTRLYSYFTGTLGLEECLRSFGSRGFSTGLDCSLKPEFRYFKSVFEE